mgnify:CR=1 FL=1
MNTDLPLKVGNVVNSSVEKTFSINLEHYMHMFQAHDERMGYGKTHDLTSEIFPVTK